MKKAPMYSRSPRRDRALVPSAAAAEAAAPAAPLPPPSQAAQVGLPAPPPVGRRAAWKARAARHAAPLWGLGGALLAIAVMLGAMRLQAGNHPLTQDDIDAAVRESLEKEPLPSAAAKAYEEILPSVVRVVGLMDDGDTGDDTADKAADPRAQERSVGTGVVIIENGTILTNLHVVAGAKRVRVRFADGHESEAQIIGTQPDNDLAVIRASSLPDDLEAATMRSTSDLRPGDHVIAVGHPFGIGPSVSYGVVSGLKREFRSPEGARTLTNLIQFDAAANPGNSGGPLVTMDGHVVGIVTAILNPSEQRTFIGIAFAVPIENAAAAAGMAPF
jgi:S1-C subfamily serine protease